jgi:hypothetical protein
MRVIGSAIQRVNEPALIFAAIEKTAFFRDDTVIGKVALDLTQQIGFRAFIHFSKKIYPSFVVDLMFLKIAVHEDISRMLCDLY